MSEHQEWYVKSEIPLRMWSAMHRAGLTPPMLGEALDVNFVTVYAWLSGKRKPCLYHFVRFCELCKVDVKEVLYGKEKT